MPATITVRQASRLGGYAKPYVAKILGTDPQFKFARSFLEPTKKDFGAQWTFDLEEEGLYEVCDRNSKGAKRVYWYCYSAGVLQECVSDQIAGEWLAALDDARAVEAAKAAEESASRRNSDLAAKAARIENDPIANAQAAAELAAEKVKRLGVVKEDYLPYVRAVLTFWGRIQDRALSDDNTRASFEAIEQQLAFGKEFQKLAGREFDLASDAATYQEIRDIAD